MLKRIKNLINDEIKLSRIKAKGGPGNNGRKPGAKNRMTLDKLAKIVTDGFAEQTRLNTRIEKEISSLNNRFNNVVKVNNLKSEV